MIGLAVVVIFAVLLAATVSARMVPSSAMSNWDRFFDVHNGVVFDFLKPKDLRMKRVPTVQQRYDEAGKLHPGRTRWYEVYRGNVRVGSLEVLVPGPEALPQRTAHRDHVFTVESDGTAAFRFRPRVPQDGESLSLFEKILDTVRIQ